MQTIKLKFSVKWFAENLSPAETRPQLRAYFDNRLIRTATTIEHSDSEIQAEITGKISSVHSEIPHTLHVGFAAFAWRNNDQGAPCLQDIGTNHLNLYDIKEQMDVKGQFEHKIPLIMHTVNNLDAKEHILFKVVGLDMGGVEFAHPKINAKVHLENTLSISHKYVESTMQIAQNMKETFGDTARIRIPYNISEDGLELTNGKPLPAISFAMTEIATANVEFYHSSLKNALKRDGLNLSDFDRLNVDGKARTMALTMSNMVQSFDYVSDTVDRNTPGKTYDASNVEGYESFANGNVTGSLDCEDGGKGIDQIRKTFISLEIPNESKYKQLAEVQQIAKHYLSCLSLDAVHGAAVGDETAHIGAHLNENFIPIPMYKKWLERTKDGRKLSRTLPWPKDTHPDADNLPFMIGEGTGMYEPLGYEDSTANAHAYVYQMRSLSPYRKPIPHLKGKVTDFFIGSLTGLTDYFISQGHNVGTFWYATKQHDGSVTRGAYYTDMLNDNDNVAIVMQESVPKQVMTLINEVISIRVPPEPLVLTPGLNDPKEHNANLDYVVRSINSLNRTGKQTLVNSPVDVPVYIKDYQINRDNAQKMVAEIQKLEHVISAKYHEERFSDKFYGYCLLLTVA